MTESTPPVPADPTFAPPAAPPVRKKRRWIFKTLAVLVVLGVLLIALLPTIAGLSPVRSLVVSKAQAFIPHGKLEVADYSLGWFSGIKASGIKLTDEQGKVVIEADSFQTDLTLLQAIRQKFDLSGTVVDAAAHLVVYPNHSTNLQHVLGLDDAKPTTPHVEHKEKTETSTPLKVPNVNADITLKLHGDVTLVDAAQAAVATVRLQSGSGGTIHISDINAPIDADLKLLYDTGDNTPAGTVGIKATVDAFENNQFDLAKLAAKLDLPVGNVDLAGLKPLLVLAKLEGYGLTGVASGGLAGEIKPGQPGAIQGAFAVAGLSVSPPATAKFKDVYKAPSLQVPIALTQTVVNGVTRLQVNVGATLPEATVKVSADLSVPAIEKLADKKMAGDNGSVNVSVVADLKKLAAALPKTLGIPAGATVDEGALNTDVILTLRPADIQSHVKTDVSVRGTTDGKPASIAPITFTSDATVTDIADPLPGLSDLTVSFASGFATFQAAGKTVATIQGKGAADLTKAQQQVAQFIDLGQMQFAGQSTFALTSQQSPTNKSSLHADLSGDVSQLHVVLPPRPPIDLATARVAAAADLQMDDTGLQPKIIQSLTATVTAGQGGDQPLVDTQIEAQQIDPFQYTAGHVTVKKCTVPSLPQLQKFLDPFVPQLRANRIAITNGGLYLIADMANVDYPHTSVDLKHAEGSLPNVRVSQAGREIFRDTVRFAAAASAKVTGGVTTVDVSQLSVDSALAKLAKADGPLTLQLQGDLPRGTGTLSLDADAVKLNQLARLAAPPSTQSATAIPQVTAGRVNGTLAMTSAAGQPATIKIDGKVAGLTLDGTPVKNETYTLVANATVPAALDGLTADLTASGDYFSVVGRNIAVRQAAGLPVQKMVQTAHFDVAVKDLARLQTVAVALVPAMALPVNAQGAIALNADVNDGSIKVDFQGNQLVVKNANGQTYAFDKQKPVTLKLSASVLGDKTIDGLHVNDLSGDFGVAQISLPQPIDIKYLATTPTASGQIKIGGAIEQVAPLLQVLQAADAPLPYRGVFAFTETVAPNAGRIGLKGGGTIDNCIVLDPAGKTQFTEKQVKLTNDLQIDLATKSATITDLDFNMADSGAARFSINGGVEDWAVARRLKNVVIHVYADGPKVWPLVYAMLPPNQQTQFKDTKLTGPMTAEFTANGSYPDKPTWNESLRTVEAYGAVFAKGVNTMGLDVSDFSLPMTINNNGRLVTGDLRKAKADRFAKPFTVNSGQGDFGSITVYLGDPALRLSIGKGQKLLQKVQINSVMAKQLGSLASIIFDDAEQATGALDLTVTDCNNVLLTELMDKKATASFIYSVHQLALNGTVPDQLASALKWGDNGIVGDVDGATLTLKDGIANQDMTVALQHQAADKDADPNAAANRDADTTAKGKKGAAKTKTVSETMKFKGGINLADNTFKDYTLTLSPGLLFKEMRKKSPDGATINLKGKVTDLNSILVQAVAQMAVEGFGQDAVDKLLGKLGNKKSKNRE